MQTFVDYDEFKFKEGDLISIPVEYDQDDSRIPCPIVEIDSKKGIFKILREGQLLCYFFEEVDRLGIVTWEEEEKRENFDKLIKIAYP